MQKCKESKSNGLYVSYFGVASVLLVHMQEEDLLQESRNSVLCAVWMDSTTYGNFSNDYTYCYHERSYHNV